jgi:hypothetical protein
MWSTREIIIFCAGAQAFHTISHLLMGQLCTFPINCFESFSFTKQLNVYAVIINAIITVLLIWWANNA